MLTTKKEIAYLLNNIGLPMEYVKRNSLASPAHSCDFIRVSALLAAGKYLNHCSIR